MTPDNDSFEALLKASDAQPVRKLTPGQKIVATVVGIDGENLFLDVGAKSEGVVNSSEFKDENGALTVSIGDRITVYFLRSSGAEQLFTARLGSGANTGHLEEAWRAAVPVEGFVKAEIKGGFEITLSGNIRAFCPFSQMGLRRVEDPAAEYIGSRMTFLISRYDENGRNIVLSARALQEEERRLKKEELRESLKEGQTVDGVISSIRTFGLFIDIGGVDGLVPISEVGWSRVDNLEDTFTAGQPVTAVIKGLDWENDRISLSIKETVANPWDEAVAQLAEGSSHIGTVARLAQFGAFVTLFPGVDGLVHISKLGQGRRINHPREVVEVGQNIEVIIESIDRDSRKISLVPSTYRSSEEEADQARQDLKSYQTAGKKAETDRGSLGSLGALLKAKLEEKKG